MVRLIGKVSDFFRGKTEARSHSVNGLRERHDRARMVWNAADVEHRSMFLRNGITLPDQGVFLA